MIKPNNFKISHDVVTTRGLNKMRAGQWRSFSITIRFQDTPIHEDDSFVLGLPFGFSLPQVDDPQGEGFVRLQSDTDARLHVSIYPQRDRYIQCMVTDGTIEPGDSVTFHIGDRSHGGPGCRTSPQSFNRVHFECFRETDGDKQVADFPTPSVRNGRRAHFYVHLTPTYKCGDEVCLTIVAEDRHGNRCVNYTGELKVMNREVGHNLPATIRMTPADHGVKRVHFCPADIPYFRISVADGHETYCSTPCIQLEDDFPYRLYFGEIHAHTEMSMDAWGSLDEAYQFARDTAVLDFAATADHQVIVGGEPSSGHPFMSPLFQTRDNPERWARTCDAARRYNDPHRFVTFPGVELSPMSTDEDINFYFLEGNPEMMQPVQNEDGTDGGETWDTMNEYLKEHEVMAIPHHPAISWRIWDRYPDGLHDFFKLDQSSMPVIEMFSKHGNSEYFGNRKPLKGTKKGRTVQDIFSAGYKFGLIGGSDTHYGNPGSRMKEPGPYTTLQYQNGLAAVWARDLTRQSLWGALFARRTFTTTGRKTVVFFEVNDGFMGEEIQSDRPRRINLQVWAADRIIKAEILKNNEYLVGDTGKNPCQNLSIEHVDETVSDRPVDFYQARITESGGEMSWTTPVWVQKA